ncbi:MAG: serine hydrolase, partial [Candidatus Aenigmarchaeota archaeon]|nr:serine hydrolase [Candidatus Aenigmarchaeota archaeon]
IGFNSQEKAKKPLASTLLRTIMNKGVKAAIQQYHDLKKNEPDSYNFAESELNSLGYRLLRTEKINEAIEIFKLNVEVYPEAFNTYDSLGEGYMHAGDNE